MKIQEVKAGMTLIADGGFDCIDEGAQCVVETDGDGLFVKCRCGRHGLDGQVGSAPDYTDDELVGLIAA